MLRNAVILSFGNRARQRRCKLSGDGILVDRRRRRGRSFLGGGRGLTPCEGPSLPGTGMISQAGTLIGLKEILYRTR